MGRIHLQVSAVPPVQRSPIMTDPDGPVMVLITPCIRCGGTFMCDPDTVPSVWVNTLTRCPLRPDGTQIEPGEPGTEHEALCLVCAPVVRAGVGQNMPVLQLFPHARIDQIQDGCE